MRIELVPRDMTKVYSALPHAASGHEAYAEVLDGWGDARAAVSCRVVAGEARHVAKRVWMQAFGEDAAPLPRSGRIGS